MDIHLGVQTEENGKDKNQNESGVDPCAQVEGKFFVKGEMS